MLTENDVTMNEHDSYVDYNHMNKVVRRIRYNNIKKFRKQYPSLNHLSNSHIMQIFEIYKASCNRQFSNQNVTFLVTGTLIILITTMFMNACSAFIAYGIMKPNNIVMNTVIASASAGCYIFLMAQFSNSFSN